MEYLFRCRMLAARDLLEDRTLSTASVARQVGYESEFAFALRGRQIRYLEVQPARESVIHEVELVKGDDATAPIVMAITIESP